MLPPLEPPPRRSSVNRHAVDYLTSAYAESNGSVGTPVTYDFAYRQTATESQTARPSLLTFRAPPYMHVESWDFTRDFYDDEILAGEHLSEQLDAMLDQPVDLSRRTTRQLQQSFVENFLRWTPIFDQQTCVNAVEQAISDSFVGSSPSTCLALFLLAVGAVTEDKGKTAKDTLPGLDYLARCSQILERLSLRNGNLMTLQCRVLQAIDLVEFNNRDPAKPLPVVHTQRTYQSRNISQTSSD
ncbi:uncharacterized protein N0V89_002771 [Didymosphaeria variabile]|uniref:Transcription factor domain-containing protein n=1 Tax=Didymosphaeria variabile TaxID=1932322 RepID=A0A9W9CEP6_9PLEO|nr:uncharacterized protein N0V89_002771 [Didymosphaeria variabile]KAJ4358192.1 hypothetical protein N0V89_002771 [Didymosphaeria variabile]